MPKDHSPQQLVRQLSSNDFDIARGKLSPPRFEFKPVRPHAAELLLRTAVLAKLVTACAPAGYGKTILLTHLFNVLRQRGHRCLWVTLDDRDTSIGGLVFLINAAVHGDLGPGLAPRSEIGERLGSPMDDPDRLLQHLSDLPGTTVLFIDNLHLCIDPHLNPLLERLAFGTGHHVRLVLSGTNALPLDLTRAKLELGAMELGPAQLCFDAASIADLLELAGLPRPSDTTLGQMLGLTEGWPAAVRLLQVLMAQSPTQEAVLTRFSGEDHDIAQVLTRRVAAASFASFLPSRPCMR